MRRQLLPLLLSLISTPAVAQQKVDIHRASSSTVSVRLSGAVSAVKVVGWANDSVAIIGGLGAGSRLEGGPFNVSGPVTGLKFYVEAPDEASQRNNKLELRVPRNARVWIKVGSADIDVQGITGGLDLNVVGGSVRVSGKPRELIVEAMDGSVTYTGVAEFAKIKTAAGDITVQGSGEDLTLTTVSGTINVQSAEQPMSRLRLESVTGPVAFSGELQRGADLRADTHSGSVELRFTRGASIEVDAATVVGTIENTWNSGRPILGREGRGMELGTSSGGGGARVQVRSFKGSVKLGVR
jgi:hypothetical protein